MNPFREAEKKYKRIILDPKKKTIKPLGKEEQDALVHPNFAQFIVDHTNSSDQWIHESEFDGRPENRHKLLKLRQGFALPDCLCPNCCRKNTQSSCSSSSLPCELAIQNKSILHPRICHAFRLEGSGEGKDGVLILPNILTKEEQILWSRECLLNYSNHPNSTNLWKSKEAEKPENSRLWMNYVQEKRRTEKPADTDTKGKNSKESLKIIRDKLEALRWVTLGYQYNWTTKEYNDDDFVEFPNELANMFEKLSEYVIPIINKENQAEIVHGVQQSGVNVDSICDPKNNIDNKTQTNQLYKCEAAIINYYHTKSTLIAHQDYSEYSLKFPIFSLSLGCTAIFLIGTTDKSDPPTPLLLHSGDLVIMGGISRLCYHGVPRIFDNSFRVEKPVDETIERLNATFSAEHVSDDLPEVVEYLVNNRININVRQVNDF